MLHDAVLSDVAFFKNQQWQVAGYAGAIGAALVAVANIFGANLDVPRRFVIGVLATVVLALALISLTMLQRRTRRCRV